MNQKSRPVSDISTGSWSPTPVYPQVNGAVSGGAVLSAADGNGDTFEVKLADLDWPKHWRDEPPGQTLTVTMTKTESGSIPTRVTLRQGNVVIKSEEGEPPDPAVLTLTRDEVEKITNYHELSVVVTAGRVLVPCCPGVGLPSLLHLTITDGGGCDILQNKDVPLQWDGVKWEGALPALENVCFMKLTFTLTCLGSGPNFALVGTWQDESCTVVFSDIVRPALSCSPFHIQFSCGPTGIGANCPCCTSTTVTILVDITA